MVVNTRNTCLFGKMPHKTTYAASEKNTYSGGGWEEGECHTIVAHLAAGSSSCQRGHSCRRGRATSLYWKDTFAFSMNLVQFGEDADQLGHCPA